MSEYTTIQNNLLMTKQFCYDVVMQIYNYLLIFKFI